MTGPGAADQTTDVRFLRGGLVVAAVRVPGHLLEVGLPGTVRLERQPNSVVELVESPDPKLECCGRLLLPWLSRTGPGTTVLDVPAPHPFDDSDVRVMWEARNRLAIHRRPPTSADADWSSVKSSFGEHLDWQALLAAVAAAGSILNGWPTRAVPAVAWLPVDRAGGRLLVGTTERSQRSHAVPAGVAGTPARTARRTTTRQDRTLHAVAAVASLLADRLAALPVPEDGWDARERLAGLFRRVAHRSKPPRPVADPPPSGWAASLTSTYSACLRVLSTVHESTEGVAPAPLSEIWELYEAWVAEQVLTELSALLGESQAVEAAGTCIARWTDIELHLQPLVPAGVNGNAVSILGQEYSAAVGALQPDILLARRSGGVVRSAIVEVKKRSAVMQPDDFTLHASKYLWGIRHLSDPHIVPVVLRVVIAAPLGGPSAALPEGKAEVLRAHPNSGWPPSAATALLNALESAGPGGRQTGGVRT